MITRGKIIVKPGSCILLWPENAAAAEHVAAKETLLFSRYITVWIVLFQEHVWDFLEHKGSTEHMILRNFYTTFPSTKLLKIMLPVKALNIFGEMCAPEFRSATTITAWLLIAEQVVH